MGCSDATFRMTPTDPPGAAFTEVREVCFHSLTQLGDNDGECPVYNYSMPPNTDFSEFVDIFYGGTMCDDEFLSEFDTGAGSLAFSGLPTRSPDTIAAGPLATGTYFIRGGSQRGNFEYFWPSQ